MRLPPKTQDAPHYRRLRYRLDCGREVEVEGFYVSPSTIRYLEGSKEYIRDPIIEKLPESAREQFPGINGLFIKPVPDGELAIYTFMVDLICYRPVSDTDKDMSSLTVCWLGDTCLHTSGYFMSLTSRLVDTELRATGAFLPDFDPEAHLN